MPLIVVAEALKNLPISSQQTEPTAAWSPFHISGNSSIHIYLGQAYRRYEGDEFVKIELRELGSEFVVAVTYKSVNLLR
jgi:hypothetical protein